MEGFVCGEDGTLKVCFIRGMDEMGFVWAVNSFCYAFKTYKKEYCTDVKKNILKIL